MINTVCFTIEGGTLAVDPFEICGYIITNGDYLHLILKNGNTYIIPNGKIALKSLASWFDNYIAEDRLNNNQN